MQLNEDIDSIILAYNGTSFDIVDGVYTPVYNTSTSGQNDAGSQGFIHENKFVIDSPMEVTFEAHMGNKDQRASALLVGQANTNSGQGFKLQNDGDIPVNEYWGPNHRVLDTAYVAKKAILTADDTQVPNMDYVVKGKLLNCYNYDYSFNHNPSSTYSSESQANFALGESVTLKKTSDNSTIASTTIIDKWYFYGYGGAINYRFRFDLSETEKELVLDTKSFYMEDGSANQWHMVTHDYTIAENQPIGDTLRYQVSAMSWVDSTPDYLQLTLSDTIPVALRTSGKRGALVIGYYVTEEDSTNSLLRYDQISADFSLDIVDGTTVKLLQATSTDIDPTVYDIYLCLTNVVDIGSVSLDTNITTLAVKNTLPEGSTATVYRNITSYSNPYAFLEYPLNPVETPSDTNSYFSLYLKEEYTDLRASTNPSMILLDYLMSTRYGAGLRPDQIDLDSFLFAGRVCDTTSDITLFVPSATTITVGDVYKYQASSLFKWQGTVKSYESYGSGYKVTFTNCIGKLTNKTNNFINRVVGDVVYDPHTNLLYPATGSTTATWNGSSITGVGAALSSFNLTRVSGSGDNPLSLSVSNGNPITKYSLYDCDWIKYWKYLGWDSHDQRWVTRHQSNIIIDTSQPVLSNIDAILANFNGTIIFENGKYSVDVEVKKNSDNELWWDFANSLEGFLYLDYAVTLNRDYISLSPSGTTARFQKSSLDFWGGDNEIVRLKIRRVTNTAATWYGRITWTTDTQTNFGNASYRLDVADTTILGDWVVLTWDFSNTANWNTQYITGIRFVLDYVNDFDVDYAIVGASYRVIEADDIIGAITIKDEGLSKSYNSLSASIPDPQNSFNSRAVSFFNSDYLAEDRGIVKSTNFGMDGITNYYNARLAVEQTLRKSRFGRSISFTMRPSGLSLSPSDLIRIVYPRYGWNQGKYFRVSSLTHTTDCLVQVVAEEYDDSMYFIQAPKESTKAIAYSSFKSYETIDAPTGLVATSANVSPSTEEGGNITLSWTTPTNYGDSASAVIEIWRSDSLGSPTTPSSSGAQLIISLPAIATSFTDSGFTDVTSTPYYYWLRTRSIRNGKSYYSVYTAYAEGTTTGISATDETPIIGLQVDPGNTKLATINKNSIVVAAGSDGWDTQVYSLAGYTAATISFTAASTDKQYQIGYNTSSPDAAISPSNIEYSIRLNADTTFNIIESNVTVYSSSYSTGDVFGIVATGDSIDYFKNGTKVKSTKTINSDSVYYYFDSSFYSGNLVVNYVDFSPTNFINSISTKQNLFDGSTWYPGSPDGTASWPTVGGSNNFIAYDTNYEGNNSALWKLDSDGSSGSWGGWYSTSNPANAYIGISVDTYRTYRFALPVKRVAGSGSNSTLYFGVAANVACDVNTTTSNASCNFCSVPVAALPTGDWVLVVGYIYPANTTGATNSGSGIYDISAGDLIKPGVNFTWHSSAKTANVNAYINASGSSDATDELQFGLPLVTLVSGVEVELPIGKQGHEFVATEKVLLTKGYNTGTSQPFWIPNNAFDTFPYKTSSGGSLYWNGDPQMGATVTTATDAGLTTANTHYRLGFVKHFADINDPEGFNVKKFNFVTLPYFEGAEGNSGLVTAWIDSYYALYLGVNQRKVYLSSDTHVINTGVAKAAGIDLPLSAILLTATAYNTTGTVYYEFVNASTDRVLANSTSNTYTVNTRVAQASPSYAGKLEMPYAVLQTTNIGWKNSVFEVRIREGGTTGPILARDQVVIPYLYTDGGITITQSRASGVVSVNSSGVYSYTNTGTRLGVFQNTTQLTYNASLSSNSTWRINSITGYGITPGTASTSSNYRLIGDHSDMEYKYASISYLIEYKDSSGTTGQQSLVQVIGQSRYGWDPFPDSDFIVSLGGNTSATLCDRDFSTGTLKHSDDQSTSTFIQATAVSGIVLEAACRSPQATKYNVSVTHTPSNYKVETNVETQWDKATTSSSTAYGGDFSTSNTYDTTYTDTIIYGGGGGGGK